jgi:hypothetical protein
MPSPYTLEHTWTIEPSVEYYTVLVDQLEYISYMSNYHEECKDRLQKKLLRLPKKKFESDEYNTLLDMVQHHYKAFLDLNDDFMFFRTRRQEVEKVLVEKGELE